MTNIKGEIKLLDIYESISQIKKYEGISEREKIIKSWIKQYNLKNKRYYLCIIPSDMVYLQKKKTKTGIVSLSIKDKIEMFVYTSIDNRDKIINNWIEKYRENFIINITPYE